LKAVEKLTAEYRANGERYLSTGYQQLLGRKKSDGSYSMWRETGDASIWLTAYVAKLLGHVKDLVQINDKYIFDALNYLTARQNGDGSFPEKSHSYYYLKTKSQQGVSLTAFCAIAFLENVDYREKYKSTIDKALTYINSKVAHMSDNFAMAISAYAFALSENPAVEGVLDELKQNAIASDDKMYWNREAKLFSTSESPSVNVEIAAYVLMAFVKTNRAAEALPIMNWLMTQRTSEGGFYSTTDTVVGLQALAMIATVFHTPNVNMEVKLSYEKVRKAIFNINPQNAMQLQYKELEKDTRTIGVNAEGSGFAFLQIAYRYNVILDDPATRFELTAAPKASNNRNLLTLKICTNYIAEDEIKQSQMTLIEVHLPSGYVYDPETAELVQSVGVRVIILMIFYIYENNKRNSLANGNSKPKNDHRPLL
jgi:CD109 antigen